MLKQGVGSLSNAELLALIIRTGDTATRKSAIDLGREIIAHFGDNLRELGSTDLAEICTNQGHETGQGNRNQGGLHPGNALSVPQV
jgi:DNA repair protein RadC